jgi:phage shock protein A
MAKKSLDRLVDIWRSNVNDLLDKMEDPEKMVRQLVRDMEVGVDGAVEDLSRAVANQRRLERQEEQNRAEIEKWQAKAEQAVEKGDEEYARLALIRKADLAKTAEELPAILAESRETTARLRIQLEEMRAKLEETRKRQDDLSARYRAARSSQGGDEGSEESNDPFTRLQNIERRVQDHEEDFARYEQKVDVAAAEADLYRQMGEDKKTENELKKMDREKKVEEELAALRDKMNKAV